MEGTGLRLQVTVFLFVPKLLAASGIIKEWKIILTVAQGLNWTICLTGMLSKDNFKCLLLIRMTLSGSAESYIYWNMGFP